MNTTKAIVTMALALGASVWSGSIQAQDRPDRPGRGEGRGPGGPPIFRVLDADRDGVISEAELAGAVAALRTLDRNGDGKLTVDELRPARPEGAREPREGDRPPGAGERRRPNAEERGPRGPQGDGQRPASPFMASLDTNKDGEIGAQELANAPAALKALDKNQDGKLTPDEFRPARGEGRGPGGRRGDADDSERPRRPRAE